MNNLDTIISNDAWDALSLAEKAEMMRVAVNNGITDLQEIRKQYNEFAEGGDTESSWSMQDEANYRQWRSSLPDNLRDTNDNDYDMRGAFKAGMQPILELDGKYHLQSRDPKTGRILKAPHHPTYIQAINTDARMGYYPIVDSKGQTYTQTWKGNLFGKGGSKDDDLVDWIIREEGFSAKPENIGDGKITLGSGLTNPKWHQLYKKRGNKWSASDNRRAVREEVANRRRWAEKNVPNWDYLPDSSQKALLSYKYNYNFNRTNSPKLFQALEDHNYTEAARQMDATSKDSKFKKGLQARRKREQKWFLNDFMETTPTTSPATSSTPTIPSFDVVFTEPAASTNIFNPYVQQVTNTQYVPLREPAPDSYIETIEVTPEEQRRRKLQQVMEAHTRFNNIMELIRPRREKIPQFIPDNFLDNYNIGYSRGGKIHIKPENRGKFTALKERTGHSATWFKQHGTPAQKKMATFALNAKHWKHGLGGNLFDGITEESQQMTIIPDNTYVNKPIIISPIKPAVSTEDVLARTNRVYSNYSQAQDNPLTKFQEAERNIRRYLKDNFLGIISAGVSNCTLTATQWIDPSNPIKNAASIMHNPDKYGYSPIENWQVLPGNILITKHPKKESYHTMLVTGFTNEDGVYNFEGKNYKYKKGEPLLTYSRGGHDNSFIKRDIPLSVYTQNSDGKTKQQFYKYNKNKTQLPEIIITPNN